MLWFSILCSLSALPDVPDAHKALLVAKVRLTANCKANPNSASVSPNLLPEHFLLHCVTLRHSIYRENVSGFMALS